MTVDAKHQELSHADKATKIAEIHMMKVEKNNDNNLLELKSYVETLKQELEKPKYF